MAHCLSKSTKARRCHRVTPQREKIFLAAIELESFDDREAFLKEACGGDDILRQRVDALIFAHERPESLLEHAAPKLDEGPSSTQTVELSDGEDPNATVPSDSQTEDRSQQNTSSPPSRTRVHYFGDYELLQEIARGGMADVYLARDLLLDRPVAVKVLFDEFSGDPSFVERFRREAQAAANLNHPNIVSVYDWGEEQGTYFIVMEYVEGRSLAEMLRTEGGIHPDRAADIAADIAAALAFAGGAEAARRWAFQRRRAFRLANDRSVATCRSRCCRTP